MMYIPKRYLPHLPAIADASGNVIYWPEPDIYPPPGHVGIGLFNIGNGDEHSFYWPIGKENAEPIVCETYHDEWSYQPEASTLEGMTARWLAEYIEDIDDADDLIDDFEYQNALEIAESLGVNPSKSTPETIVDWLELDLHSPKLLLTAGREAFKQGDVPKALQFVNQSLSILPEYTEALSQLAAIYLRLGNKADAATALILAISSPRCFGGDRNKCLERLKRLSDNDAPNLEVDPLWKNRHRLTFAAGVKENDDFAIYEEAIAVYLHQGHGIRAVRLRILVGELMWRETISFRERYAYTKSKHLEHLRAEIEQAGLVTRLPAVNLPMD